MARWKNTFEHDLKELIRNLTGFREREENFNLCLQFATSNVKYHRFLDVDSHKVTDVLNGTINKFLIHSQQQKADVLRKLSDEFLEAPVFEGRDTGKTDTHYALLSLLLSLSNSPTLTEYVEQPRLPKEQAPKETFDWAAYLLEGEEEPSHQYISDIESEDDWIDDDEDEEERSPRGDNQDSPEDTPPPPFPDVSLSTIQADESTLVAMDTTPPVETGFDWLTRNVVVQYWCGQSADDTDSQFSNLNRDWESYKQRSRPLYTKRKQTIITETNLMREILWMLGGVSDFFIFIYNGHRFLVREDVALSHLTENSLEAFLEEFTEHGAYIQNLLKFEEEVINQSCCYGDSSGTTNQRGICQTLQAFSQVVFDFIKSLRQELTKIEKLVIKQEETFTLAMLYNKLKPWLPKVKVIHSIYERGVKEAEWLPGNYQKASQLLSVLYDTVMEHDAMSSYSSEMMNLLLPMWIQTCRPYLDIIDAWVTKGNLPDPMEEFIVKRNENVRSLDESFWETAFTIHIPSDQSLLEESMSRQPGSRSLDTTQSKGTISHWAPQFLQPILLEVVLAGKSMEMFQGLGCLREVVGKQDDIFYKATPLYDTFLESLEKLLNSENSETSKKEDTQTAESDHEMSIFTQQIEDQMKIRGTFDRLLRINFDTVFTACMKKISPDSITTEDVSNSVLKVTGNGLQPLSVMLQECLYPHIQTQYSKICTHLVVMLKEEYHLMEYLASMRHFFLMEAGDTMFEFYAPIFDKIRLHEHWRDASSVNLTLQEALQTYFPDEVNRLTIEISSIPSSSEPNPINVTDCMTLHYKVPWPVDVVINTKCQNIYNQVFSFLLQIKRAKYCLDELRFFDLEKEDIIKSRSRDEELLTLDEELASSARVHRVHVLRMRLLFFVNSLHNYIMTRILHSTGLEFQTEIQKARDLDQIIKVHNDYIHKIHERCLLHNKVKFLKEAVMKVLNLILTFHNLWDKGIHHISIKTIQEIEVEFSRCIQFLASFLNNVIKRGSFPHLESLAFALITSTEHVTRLRPH
ncbi:gamma-tubulin complex component 5-like isoform X2 [Pecten maximus]|uniref:gamma-tubulin complex component 5-like isoform X1 n=1 Tax=Pecten maximus TaxID=6579 RepID=UPI00145846AE|nr:gamma-tubulin complex component 5-like isoform X1 [Pecten maximus]XP_033727240.1 gamma-tubulin complex component 5-like isoform X2 [Pecten maximus]